MTELTPTQTPNVQALQGTNRGVILQLQQQSQQHQEANKRLSGLLERYAELYTALKNEAEQLKSINRTQEQQIASLTADKKSLTEQVRVLTAELQFLMTQAQMIASEIATGDSQIHDSTLIVNAVYEQHPELEAELPDLSVDLKQTMAVYENSDQQLVVDNIEGDPQFDLNALENELNEREAESATRQAAE